MLSVLRHRDFRLLWLGQSTSVVGDAMLVVAIGLFVTRLTGSARDVGVVLAAYSTPLVVFVLLGGAIADRLPRQRVMIASDLARGALHVLAAVLIATGAVRVGHLVAIGIAFGVADAFFRPAAIGLVPQTVPEDDIQRAMGLMGLSREVATFVGPALATGLVLGVGAAWTFGLDALSFVVSALLLARIRPRARGDGADTDSASLARQLREGWDAVRARSWVWATVLAFSTALFTALAPFFVLGASLAEDLYGRTAVYGWANAAWGIGTATGVVVGARLRPRRPLLTAQLLAVGWPASIAAFALRPPVAVLLALMVLAGAGIGVFGVLWETALAERIPPHLLSRVSAYDWLGSLALVPLGYVVAGPLGEALGPARVTAVGGAVGTLAMVLGLLPRQTRTLGLDDPPPADVAEEPAAAAAEGVSGCGPR